MQLITYHHFLMSIVNITDMFHTQTSQLTNVINSNSFYQYPSWTLQQ